MLPIVYVVFTKRQIYTSLEFFSLANITNWSMANIKPKRNGSFVYFDSYLFFGITIWMIWKDRNSKIFEGVHPSIVSTVGNIRKLLSEVQDSRS